MRKTIFRAVLVGWLAGVILAASSSLAETSFTYVGGGTLSWPWTRTTQSCGIGGSSQFTEWLDGPFTFVFHGTSYPLGGQASYIDDFNNDGCPPDGPNPAAGEILNGPTFTITFHPGASGSGTATIMGTP